MRYKIVNSKRFIIFIILAMGVISVIATSVLNYNKASGKTLDEHIYITVNEGDTLWSIVNVHMKEKDIRKAVYVVRKLNSLEDANIHPGQQLKIPVY